MSHRARKSLTLLAVFAFLIQATATAQTCLVGTPLPPGSGTPPGTPPPIQFTYSCNEDSTGANPGLCRFQALFDPASAPSDLQQLTWNFDDAAGESRCGGNLFNCDPKYRTTFMNTSTWAFHSFSSVGKYYAVRLTATYPNGVHTDWPAGGSCPNVLSRLTPDPPGCFWAPLPAVDPVVFWYWQDEGMKKRILLDHPNNGFKNGSCYAYYFHPCVPDNAQCAATYHYVPPACNLPSGCFSAVYIPTDGSGNAGYFQYPRPGTYKLRLEIDEWRDCVIDTSHFHEYDIDRDVDVTNVPPAAAFTYSVKGATVTFDASGSRDDGPNPLAKYVWNFGDGTSAETTAPSITHTYTGNGTPGTVSGTPGMKYDVVLKVTDDLMLSGTSAVQTVGIIDQPPAANFTYQCTPVAGSADSVSCTFDGRSSKDEANDVESYTWSLDTNNPDDPANPNVVFSPQAVVTHVYKGLTSAQRKIIVSLSVRDSLVQSPTVYRTIVLSAPAANPDLRFVAITPCRLFDSRTAGVPLASNSPRDVSVAGMCPGLPAAASRISAAAVTFTAISPQATGYLTAYPSGAAQPLAAALNFDPPTSPRANNVVVATGTNGAIRLAVSVATHVTADITGYFTTDSVVDAGAWGPYEYAPLPPCRVFDSRVPGTPLVTPNVARVKVRGGACTFPDDAAAGAFNLTLITPTGSAHGILYGSLIDPSPVVASLFVQAGSVVAEGVLAKLGLYRTATRDDDLTVLYGAPAGNRTDYTVDTTGYFSQKAGLRFHPLVPCRLLDTRIAQYGVPRASSNEQVMQARSTCGIPPEAQAIAVNTVAIGTDGPGFFRLYAAGTDAPATSTLNYGGAEPAIGNTTIVQLGASLPDLAMRAYAGPAAAGCDVVLDVYGYFAPVTTTQSATTEARQ